MHQDAYSKYTATADPSSCPPGTSPAKGWDGAPAWAVLTDGASTCLAGSDRNSSPAVVNAWNNFYDDTGGIRDEFTKAWGFVAKRFAGDPAVAGYDLLNEPETSRPAAQLQGPYDALIADAVAAIRTAEAGSAFHHLIFLEPAIPAGTTSNGLVIPDPAALPDHSNLVGATHNYAESIQADLPIDVMNDVMATVDQRLGVPQWTGEYGWWDPSPESLAHLEHYAALEDERRWAGAWWQWRQSCGDPHSLSLENGKIVPPTGTNWFLDPFECPQNTSLAPYEPFLKVIGRAYPRAAPGQLTELKSDPDTGHLLVEATAPEAGGTLVVWLPDIGQGTLEMATRNLTSVHTEAVTGGRILTARVTSPGAYALGVGVKLPSAPTTAPPNPLQDRAWRHRLRCRSPRDPDSRVDHARQGAGAVTLPGRFEEIPCSTADSGRRPRSASSPSGRICSAPA